MKLLLLTTPTQQISGISRVDFQIIKQLTKHTNVTVGYFQPLHVPLFLQKIVSFCFNKDLQGIFNNIPFKLPQNNFSSYDIIYIMNQQNTLALNWIPTKKVIVSVRDVIKNQQDNKIGSFILSLYQKACFLGIKKAPILITDSESEKKHIIQTLHYKKNIITIPLGIDPKEFHKQKKCKKPFFFASQCNVLFVGTEEKRKNFPTVLKAIAYLKKSIPTIRLIKVGNPLIQSERIKNIQLIQKLGIEQNVFFVGHIEKGIAKYYNAADVLVMPSLKEGFGFPILEAMACGCPVIASQCDSLPEIGKDAIEYIDDPFDYKNLANKISILLTHTKIRNNNVSKGLKRAKDFSWDITGNKIVSLCYSIMKGK
ncbi:MAG: glycosyltransferase family 1 protein [Candidatus Woesearchaeota archaeon]|jgi:glycosyltransferase involved in cell wall biosynthesis